MKNKSSKLSLDQFKAKARNNQESLEYVSGGILGACHDGRPTGPSCFVYNSGKEQE